MLAVWDLPGPSGFVSHAGKDLFEGCSVILALPQIYPHGLRKKLDAVMYDYGLGLIEIHLDEWRQRGCMTPEEILTELFSIEVKGKDIFSKVLASSPQFTDQRQVIWVEGVTPDEWPRWRRFLDEYEHPSRGIDVWKRTVFVVVLEGEPIAELPRNKPAVALKIHRFAEGAVQRIDALLHVFCRLGGSDSVSIQDRLLLNMIVELSGPDFDLADRLCSETIDTVSTPTTILQEVSKRRGWDKIAPAPATAHTGTVSFFDGQQYLNSAYLAACGQDQEIARRLWRAQLAVIFPMIEEKRVKFIERMKGQLPLPFSTGYGDILKEDDLEISHLCYMAKSNKLALDRSSIRVLEKLRDMRNSLAHLETIPQEYLSDTMLFRFGV